jgi:hypothetical protein
MTLHTYAFINFFLVSNFGNVTNENRTNEGTENKLN